MVSAKVLAALDVRERCIPSYFLRDERVRGAVIGHLVGLAGARKDFGLGELASGLDRYAAIPGRDLQCSVSAGLDRTTVDPEHVDRGPAYRQNRRAAFSTSTYTAVEAVGALSLLRVGSDGYGASVRSTPCERR